MESNSGLTQSVREADLMLARLEGFKFGLEVAIKVMENDQRQQRVSALASAQPVKRDIFDKMLSVLTFGVW